MKKYFMFFAIGFLGLSLTACPDNNSKQPSANSNANANYACYKVEGFNQFNQLESAFVIYPTKEVGDTTSCKAKNQAQPMNLDGKKPMLLIVHGYLGGKEAHIHQAKNAAKQGMISIVFTTSFHTNDRVAPRTWSPAYKQMIELAQREATDASTPINAKADTNNISLMGHSMGGGGLFHFADDYPADANKVKTYIALAPYKIEDTNLSEYEAQQPYAGSSMNKPVLILSGEADTDISATMPKGYYEAVPNSVAKARIVLKGVEHNDYGNSYPERSNMHEVIDKYIADWIKIQVFGENKDSTIYKDSSLQELRNKGEITDSEVNNL